MLRLSLNAVQNKVTGLDKRYMDLYITSCSL